MLDSDVPSGTSNTQASTRSVDDLLRDHEVRSGWKVVATTNLLSMCHTGTCEQCSSSLEHLLTANRVGEMCARPADLPKMLDRAWPATMGDIREDVASPLLGEIENANRIITDRDDEIAHLRGKVNCLRAERNEELARCTFDSNSYTEYESRAPRTISRIVGNSVFGTCVISLIQIHNPNSDVFQV